LARVASAGDTLNGGAPTLIGEFGIPYDLNGGEAYRQWAEGERGAEIWSAHTAALTATYDALDALLLSSTQWNYTASNRNDPMVGDGWNQEDLSIWSPDQVEGDDPDSGARALEGFCRGYAQAAQGTLVSQRWDRAAGVFDTTVDVDATIAAPTIIFLPAWMLADDLQVVDHGTAACSVVAGTVHIRCEESGMQRFRVERAPGSVRVRIESV
jgi:hypothetical protein